MVITKADLQDWNSNPVTKNILQACREARQETLEGEKIRDTADQTAMQAARDAGFCEGIMCILEAYDEALEVTE